MAASAEAGKPDSDRHGGKQVNGGDTPEDSSEPPEKKPSPFKKAWTALGLDPPTIIVMLKGAMPPIISIAAFEGTAWANHFTTLGYLVTIMSLLGFCIMPRAKFVQTMTLNVIFVLLASAIALLQIYCVVKARQHTTPPASSQGSAVGASGSTQSPSYNSSASTVAALWLFVLIYGVSVVRAKMAQLQFPCIIFSIYTIVAANYSPEFPTMASGMSFARNLLEAFLTGFGIATAVSFLIFPMTSRFIASKQMAGLLKLLQVSLKAQGAYMNSISTSHRIVQGASTQGEVSPNTGDEHNGGHQHHRLHRKQVQKSEKESSLSTEAQAMKSNLFQLGALFGKVQVEIGFAKKEFAYGKLGPTEFNDITMLIRDIMLPTIGMTTFIDILQSVRERNSTEKALFKSEDTIEAIRKLESEEWEDVMSLSHDQFNALSQVLQQALTHVSLVLEFTKSPKKPEHDAEKEGEDIKPGSPKFAEHLTEEIRKFNAHRESVLRRWCEVKGVELPKSFWDNPSQHYSMKDHAGGPDNLRQRMNQQQFYLVLYVEFLIFSIGKSILKMVNYADSKVQDGTMKKKRIIAPGWHRMKKLLEDAFAPSESDNGFDDAQLGGSKVWVGDSLKPKKDPEHLPPANFFEKATNFIRVVPAFLASPESSFGFRSAVATLSIGILAYLKATQHFFVEQRLLWSLIMIAISMTPQAGQSIFQFILRIAGTAIAMVLSMAIWYMCDQKTGAVIPMTYLFTFLGFYVLVKFPKFLVAGVISLVTVVLIIGYELQVRKLGLKEATSNGQPYYPDYELGPYRLATVAGGLVVAFIWVYFPYPITTHSTLRKDLGSTLYLLANFYSCVHTTVDMRLHLGPEADESKKGSPSARLAKARHKVFTKVLMLLNKLREHSSFLRFEPTFGGKFPKQTYDELIQSMQTLFNFMALISYSTLAFTTEASAEESAWLRDFRHFTSDLNLTSHEITSTLCLVSASVTNKQPLPPYLRPPRPYDLVDHMEEVDPEIISVKHVSEPCYAAFAVLEIASSLISMELAKIIKHVQELVGEVDFSFHVISTSSDSSSQSTLVRDESDSDKGKKE